MAAERESLRWWATVVPYSFGGLAAMGATLVTNPIEVVKTRLQLQVDLLCIPI